MILCVGIGIFVLMGLFPPAWVATGPARNPIYTRWFILNQTKGFLVDKLALYTQWVGVGVCTAVLFVAFRAKKAERNEQNQPAHEGDCGVQRPAQ